MSEPLATLRPSQRSARVHLLGPAAEGAIHRGYDIWGPLEFYASDLRDQYLAGEVKGVLVSVPTKLSRCFQSFCIVPTPPAEREAAAARHRKRLLLDVQAQYKDAVVRAIASDAKRAKRLRHAMNTALGGSAPDIEATDRHFAGEPAALAAAAGIKRIWTEVAAL